MLNIHHLELFYHVARAGGITAALRLIPYGIQQPAVSQQMGQLEEAIGAKLFHRRPFSLTPVGREVQDYIAPFFSGLPQLAGKLNGQTRAQLRLAASGGVMRDYFPALLFGLERRVPGLRLTLRESSMEGATRLLRDHEADVAFGLYDREHATGLQFTPLVKLPVAILTPESSPLVSGPGGLRKAVAGAFPLSLRRKGTNSPPHSWLNLIGVECNGTSVSRRRRSNWWRPTLRTVLASA